MHSAANRFDARKFTRLKVRLAPTVPDIALWNLIPVRSIAVNELVASSSTHLQVNQCYGRSISQAYQY